MRRYQFSNKYALVIETSTVLSIGNSLPAYDVPFAMVNKAAAKEESLSEHEHERGGGVMHGCQMAIAGFLDRMCLALQASGPWLRYATLQNLIPSFPWIAPGWRAWGRNPRKGRNQILQRSVAEP